MKRKSKKPLAFSEEKMLLPVNRGRIPKRWVKFIVGWFLLLPTGILTQTFFEVFVRTARNNNLWAMEEFWFFSLGVLIWLIIFLGLPRPLRLYVFGHELTHVVWVWLMGGNVFKFKVRKDGGYILADRVNTWIALAPYFFPIYSLIVVIGYGLAGFFWDLSHLRQLVFALIGGTWGFHFTFTCWAIWKGQQDLVYGGIFFSLIIIYLANLLLLVGMLVMASPNVSAWDFAQDFFHNMDACVRSVSTLLKTV